MSDILSKYAEWVSQTCACASCAADAPQSVHCLVNRNINPIFTSMPQAGYLGLDYQYSAHRVLVLGKNPAGGPNGDSKNDIKHYPRLLRIVDSASVSDESGPLQDLYNHWRPLMDLKLEQRVGLKPSEIVYANQILCRSDNHKPDENRGRIGLNKPKDVQLIYSSCFRNRIVDLVRISEPRHIIALGKKKSLSQSWPTLLENLLASQLPNLTARVWPVIFPYPTNRWSEDDLLPIRECLGILK